MTYDEWINRFEDEFYVPREQPEGVTGGEQQVEGLTDEIKGKLLEFRSRLRDAAGSDDSDASSAGSH